MGRSGQTIAVLGEMCARDVGMFMDMSPFHGRDSYFMGGSGRVVPKTTVNVLEGLIAKCQVKDCIVKAYTSNDVGAALDFVAREGADVAILCGDSNSGENWDRDDLNIRQHQWLTQLTGALAIPKVVITMATGTVVMPWFETTDAMLAIFAPGKWAGYAFAEVLLGDHNPFAKSPIYYPTSEAVTTQPTTQPSFGCGPGQLLQINYTEGLCINWHCQPPQHILFPFGHGLSFTNFSYSQMVIHSTAASVAAECPARLRKAPRACRGRLDHSAFPHLRSRPADLLCREPPLGGQPGDVHILRQRFRR